MAVQMFLKDIEGGSLDGMFVFEVLVTPVLDDPKKSRRAARVHVVIAESAVEAREHVLSEYAEGLYSVTVAGGELDSTTEIGKGRGSEAFYAEHGIDYFPDRVALPE